MKRVNKIELECENCADTFYRYPSQLKRKNRGRFCSKKCMEESRKNGSNLTCHWCGNTFYRRYGEQKETEKSFCSKVCYDTFRFRNIKDTTYIKRFGRHEHIIVVERYLERKIKKGEIVHHIDGNKHNNNISNLALLPNQSMHASVHFGNLSPEEYCIIKIKEQDRG